MANKNLPPEVFLLFLHFQLDGEHFGHLGESRATEGSSLDSWVNMSNSSYIQILLEEDMKCIGLIHRYSGITAAHIPGKDIFKNHLLSQRKDILTSKL